MANSMEVSEQTKDEISETGEGIIPKFRNLDIIEIDLWAKAKTIWEGRRTILITVIVSLAAAYFHTEYGPVEYTSMASVIQESEGASVGDFGSSFLRSLTGMNFQGGGGDLSAAATGRAPLPVSLYPQIVSSTEFQKELIYTELEFSNLDSTITLYEYYHEVSEPALRDRVYSLISDMTIYLPFTIYDWTKDAFRGMRNSLAGFWSDDDKSKQVTVRTQEETPDIIDDSRLQSVTKEEMAVIMWLRLRISLASSGGIMEISTTLPDPKGAAVVNAILVEYIQDYITNYRIEKAQQNLEAVLNQYEEAKQRYERAQYELAEFRDQNVNLSTNQAQIEESRLSNEASLRFNVYNSIAQEVEQARMVVQQQIPVFNTLEKPNIPTAPSTGSSPLLMAFSGILGFFGGVVLVLLRNSSLF